MHHVIVCNNYLASLAIKCKDIQNREFEVEWEHLMYNFRIVFEDDVIEELKEGLELGWHLDLPTDYCCHYQHLSSLFSGCYDNPIIRPFKHLRYIIVIISYEIDIANNYYVEIFYKQFRIMFLQNIF